MEHFDRLICDLLSQATRRETSQIEELLELPLTMERGDRAVPCFRWAKEDRISPQDLAKRIQDTLLQTKLPPDIERVQAEGGYVNFFIRRSALAKRVLNAIARNPGRYGFLKREHPPVAVIEFSSPNIAKPFSIGHLRSTNIGAALSRIFSARGWRVVTLNHLGDWGTQFGKLIAAYRRWGNAEMLHEDPIHNLFKLYVRFHEQEVSDPTLIEEAREWFSKLEREDPEARELWQWFRELSLMELKRLYKVLDVDFDYYWGESYYGEGIDKILAELDQKGITRMSDDALIVDLEPYNLPTCVVKKKDDSSLYLTRDLAAAVFRYEQFEFDRMLYVVGSPQQLHFKQVFKILELLGYPWIDRCEHVSFGHISFGDEAMSTRKGNVVFLTEVLDRAVEIAKKIVDEKNPDLEDRESVASAVGLGALLFADLSSKRAKDVKFSWEEILSFDGETGPYLQYTLVRTKSVLRRHGGEVNLDAPTDHLTSGEEAALIRWLAMFPSHLARAEREREPFLIAQYLIELAKLFNRFYHEHRIVDAPEDIRPGRLLLVHATSDVMGTALKLLGIPHLERM